MVFDGMFINQIGLKKSARCLKIVNCEFTTLWHTC